MMTTDVNVDTDIATFTLLWTPVQAAQHEMFLQQKVPKILAPSVGKISKFSCFVVPVMSRNVAAVAAVVDVVVVIVVIVVVEKKE